VLERKRGQVLSATTDEELSAIDLPPRGATGRSVIWLMRAQQSTSTVINAPRDLHTNLGRALPGAKPRLRCCPLGSHYFISNTISACSATACRYDSLLPAGDRAESLSGQQQRAARQCCLALQAQRWTTKWSFPRC